MKRPNAGLQAVQSNTRPAGEAMRVEELGSARLTRHSFARSFLRTAARERWAVTRELFEMDDDGRGEAIYRVDTGTHQFRLVVFSTCIEGDQRTDRVIAEAWDVTAALIEGPLSRHRLTSLRQEVPRQERGRADEGTLVWTRANRSSRFFDYVVDRLAHGLQPEPAVIGDAAYVLRSTAFYANGKWGLADYERLADDHPLVVPYRAQMLSAWLLREFSCDLAEHCATARSAHAVDLTGGWRRFFGLGNATGLGMVPYIINHPRVLDAWVALRELPLAHALAQEIPPMSALSVRLVELLQRAIVYFQERNSLPTAPYLPLPQVGSQLGTLVPLANRYQEGGYLPAGAVNLPQALHYAAGKQSVEARQVVDTLLVECFPDIDGDIENLLRCDDFVDLTLAQTCDTMRDRLERDYAWIHEYDFTDPASTAYFWYFSANSQEPRRGRRGLDLGENVEQPLGIARDMQALLRDLTSMPGSTTLAEFLLDYPWYRGPIERAQALAGVRYGEVFANLLDAAFLPLNLQRFQLAVYGMENFSPMSTDWLRVTLFAGAPRAADVAGGIDDDWLFLPKPAAATESEGIIL